MLDPADAGNLYVKFATDLNLWSKLDAIRVHRLGHPSDKSLFIFGEIYGSIQDLKYGHENGGNSFRAFDIYAGTRSDGFFLAQNLFDTCCLDAEIDTVPELYRGPYSAEAVAMHTSGPTTQGDPRQIREGIVIKADGTHPRWGRRVAKSIAEAYLLRKGLNLTEFQ